MYICVLSKHQPFQLHVYVWGWRRRDDALHWVCVVGPDMKMESIIINIYFILTGHVVERNSIGKLFPKKPNWLSVGVILFLDSLDIIIVYLIIRMWYVLNFF